MIVFNRIRRPWQLWRKPWQRWDYVRAHSPMSVRGILAWLLLGPWLIVAAFVCLLVRVKP